MWFQGQPETFMVRIHGIRLSPSLAPSALGIIHHYLVRVAWVSFLCSPSQRAPCLWVEAAFAALSHWTADACPWGKATKTKTTQNHAHAHCFSNIQLSSTPGLYFVIKILKYVFHILSGEQVPVGDCSTEGWHRHIRS